MPSVPLKVMVIDDEAPARLVVAQYLREMPEVEIIAECSNGFDAIRAIDETRPDLIFLDIQMPKINGFEMLEHIDDPPAVVFTTAYDQYAIKAFEVNAVDYLLKPFSRDRFREAVMRVVQPENSERLSQSESLKRLLAHHDARVEHLQRVVVKEGQTLEIIPTDRIDYFEANDDYVMLHARHGKFLKQKTMKFFEEHLEPSEFVRVHRSFIVRIGAIARLETIGKETYRVELLDGSQLPVSRTGYARLRPHLRRDNA